MRIAFLGIGKMGVHMVRRLLAAGHDVTVWNRTRGHAEPLAAAGAHVAESPSAAVSGAEAVMTMLFDDAAHEEVLLGWPSLLDAIDRSAIHISLATISVALSERLTAEHARRGIEFAGAPVFGRPDVAEQGRLWIVAAGTESAMARAKPLLEPLSRGISIVGSLPSEAHAVKLGGNFLIAAMIRGLSESLVYAKSQGIEAEVFFETINSALFQSPFYAGYAKVMLHPSPHPGATVDLGAKDLRLMRQAAAAREVRIGLADYLYGVLAEAQRNGLGHGDWPVVEYELAQRRSVAGA